MSGDLIAFTAAFAILAAYLVGGFALLFTELRRLEEKLERGLKDLRVDLAAEFRAQRTEVLQQTTALGNAIVAARS